MPRLPLFQSLDVLSHADDVDFATQANRDIETLVFGHQAEQDIQTLSALPALSVGRPGTAPIEQEPSSIATPAAPVSDLPIVTSARPEITPPQTQQAQASETPDGGQPAWTDQSSTSPSASQEIPTSRPSFGYGSTQTPISQTLNGASGSWPSAQSSAQLAPSGAATATPAAMPTGQPTAGQSQDLRSYARQKAQSLGINPDVAERVGMTEGGFDDPVRQNMQGAPAYGPYQLYVGGPGRPGLGDEALARGIDPRNPAHAHAAVDFALEHAAKNGWGVFQGAAAHGIGNWEGIGQQGVSDAKSRQMSSNVAGPEQSPNGTVPSDSRGITAPASRGQVYSGSYTQQGLANAGDPDAWSKCGPVAALQAGALLGRDLPPEVVERLARQRGWTAANGMAGLQSEAGLLNDMGIAAKAEQGPVDWQRVVADLQRGNPVLLQLPGHEGHYITAQKYDAQTGKIDFGSTVGDLRAAGHKTQFTPAELEGLGWGAPNGALWIDNPATPAPSVVAGSSSAPPTSSTSSDASRPIASASFSDSSSTQAPGLMYRQPLSQQMAEQPSIDPGQEPGGVTESQGPFSGQSGPTDRFIPGRTYVPTGPALVGAPTREAYPVPYPGQRNRAVPGSVDEANDLANPPAPPPSPDNRNRAVPGQVDEWYVDDPMQANGRGMPMPIRPSDTGPIWNERRVPGPDEWTPPWAPGERPDATYPPESMAYRLPLQPTPGDAYPGLNDASALPPDASAPVAPVSAPPPSAGAGAFQDTQTSVATPVLTPGSAPISASVAGSGAALPATQPILNEDQTSYPLPDYRTPASPLVSAPDPTKPDIFGQNRTLSDSSPGTSPLKPVWDAVGNVLGYVHSGTPVTPDQAQDEWTRGTGMRPEELKPGGLPAAIGSTATGIAQATGKAIIDEATAPPSFSTPALPSLRGLQDIQNITGAPGTVIGRRLGEALGLTDDPLLDVGGARVSALDVAGFIGQNVLDPTNLVSGEAPAASRAMREGQQALERAQPGIVQRIMQGVREHLTANAERTAALDAERAGQAGAPAYGALGVAPAAPAPAEIAPPFYSQLQRVIDEKMPNRAAPGQVQGILKGSAVKPEEIAWTGLDDFLTSQGGKPVTKAEVQDFLRQNEVQVQEVTKGGPAPELQWESVGDRTWRAKAGQEPGTYIQVQRLDNGKYQVTSPGGLRDLFDTAAEAGAHAEQMNAGIHVPNTKYGQYTLPGGENYRELLLTLPDRPAQLTSTRLEVRPSATNRGTWDIVDARDGRVIRPDFPNAAEANQELAFRQQQPSVSRDSANYQSAHFDEPNILAHVRFNERVAPDGARVLHIEEIQSDWHQAGRKEGYIGQEKRYAVFDPNSQPLEHFSTEAEAAAALKEKRVPGGMTFGLDRNTTAGTVPPAPFAKTWPELAMKRMIRWGAENGFDRITWTTGAQQAERFNLANRIDDLTYVTRDGAVGTLTARNRGQEVASWDNVPAQKIGDYVGQDVAGRLMSNEPDIRHFGDVYQLSGVNIQTGGEGMKGFYDKILPDVANKLGKKFGARVGESAIDAGAPVPFTNRAIGTTTVHSLDITPAMRESVLTQGQPLFVGAGTAPGQGGTDRLAGVNRALSQGVASAVSGGVGAATNQQLNPDDPNAALKGFAVGAVAPYALSRGARGLARVAGREAGPAEEATNALLATAGLAPSAKPNPVVQRVQQLAAKRAAAGVKPPNLLEISQGIRYSVGMLGNPATGILNALSGPSEIGLGTATAAVRTGMLEGRPAPVVYMMAEIAKGLAEGTVNMLGTAVGIIPKAVRESPDFRPPMAERMQGSIGKAIGYAIDTPGRITSQAPDALFQRAFWRGGRVRAAADMLDEAGDISRLRPDQQVAEIHRLLTSPTPEEAARIEGGARQFAQELGYRLKADTGQRKLGALFRHGDRPATSEDSWVAQAHDFVGSHIMPFFGTIYQINKRGLTMVPGVGSVVGHGLPVKEQLARQMVGAGLIYFANDYAARGGITGPGPSDPDKLALLRAQGWEPSSTYVPGVGYVPNLAFGAAAPILNGVGAYQDSQRYATDKERLDSQKMGERIVKDQARVWMQFPVMQGMASLYTMATQPVKGTTDFLANAASSYVPAALKAKETAGDPYSRTTDRDVSFGEQLKQKAIARAGNLPGLGTRQDLPIAQDRFGRPVENPRQGIKAILPRIHESKDDPAAALFQTNGVDVGLPPKELTVTIYPGGSKQGVGLPVPLAPAEQREWSTIRGQALLQLVDGLEQNPAWATTPPEDRQKYLQQQIARANEFTKNQMMQRPELQRRVNEQAAAQRAS